MKLFGTPAEETLVGKTYMARDGVFDGLDAALDWHPGTETKVLNDTGQANNNFSVEFYGKASHGARDPWNGRSALDAVEVMTHAANMMREHIPTSGPAALRHRRRRRRAERGARVRARVVLRARRGPRLVERHYEWL